MIVATSILVMMWLDQSGDDVMRHSIIQLDHSVGDLMKLSIIWLDHSDDVMEYQLYG